MAASATASLPFISIFAILSSLLDCYCHIRASNVTHFAGDALILLETFGIVIAFGIDVFREANYLLGASSNAKTTAFTIVWVNRHSGHGCTPFFVDFRLT
jgi:hypothetical protein